MLEANNMLCYPFPSRQVNGRIVARMGHVTLVAWTFLKISRVFFPSRVRYFVDRSGWKMATATTAKAYNPSLPEDGWRAVVADAEDVKVDLEKNKKSGFFNGPIM